MNLPQGQLIRRRVLNDPGTVLRTAFDRKLTGYARLEPQEALLLDTDGTGVITFEDGVPVAVFHTGTDTGGADALADIERTGPCRLELYRLDSTHIHKIHASETLTVPPGLPARQLTDDDTLVERTREQAPSERIEPHDEAGRDLDAVEEFLDDGSKIESIREQARKKARSRAEEWELPVDDQT